MSQLNVSKVETGTQPKTNKIPGHFFLANLGKKRLRPGGKKATTFLIESVDFNHKKVLEVACNQALTSCEIATKYDCQIEALDINQKALVKAQKYLDQKKLNHKIHLQQGNAFSLPYPDNSFDIVINEAFLTMNQNVIKQKALQEYFRVLKPGGFLLTHDIMYLHDDQFVPEMIATINMHAEPLSYDGWLNLFQDQGFVIRDTDHGKMTLMTPKGMLKDEGLINLIKIFRNGMKKENKDTFVKMRKFFSKHSHEMNYLAIVSQKPDL